MKSISLMLSSFVTTLLSFIATFDGDTVVAVVMLVLNVVTLISNTALTIYRNWRDRDKDKEE